jgi:hypothetical protein
MVESKILKPSCKRTWKQLICPWLDPWITHVVEAQIKGLLDIPLLEAGFVLRQPGLFCLFSNGPVIKYQLENGS